MADQNFSLDKYYKLKKEGENNLTISFIINGESVNPDFTIELDDKILIEHSNDSIKDQKIVSDKDLSGQVLNIDGNVVALEKANQKVNLQLKVMGGEKEFSKDFTTDLDKGDSAVFSFVIRLYKPSN